MKPEDIKKLKDKVEFCLKNYPATRNHDMRLTTQVWAVFHKENIFVGFDNKPYVYIEDFSKLPREDNVKRIRAKFQNEEGKYLPDDPEVRKARGIAEENWRKFLGYKT